MSSPLSMGDFYPVKFTLTVDTEQVEIAYNRLLRLGYRVLALFRRAGLPENMEKALILVQQFISAYYTLQAAMAATGPYGMAFAIVGGATMLFSTGDAMYNASRGFA